MMPSVAVLSEVGGGKDDQELAVKDWQDLIVLQQDHPLRSFMKVFEYIYIYFLNDMKTRRKTNPPEFRHGLSAPDLPN